MIHQRFTFSRFTSLKSFSWIGFWIACRIDIESSTLNPTNGPEAGHNNVALSEQAMSGSMRALENNWFCKQQLVSKTWCFKIKVYVGPRGMHWRYRWNGVVWMWLCSCTQLRKSLKWKHWHFYRHFICWCPKWFAPTKQTLSVFHCHQALCYGSVE